MGLRSAWRRSRRKCTAPTGVRIAPNKRKCSNLLFSTCRTSSAGLPVLVTKLQSARTQASSISPPGSLPTGNAAKAHSRCRSSAPRPDAACRDVARHESVQHQWGQPAYFSPDCFAGIGRCRRVRVISSTILGVPVELIGIAGFLGLIVLATVYRDRAETPARLALASLAGLGFALYLTYIEKFVLATWCVLCLSSLALIFCISLLSSLLWRHQAGRP